MCTRKIYTKYFVPVSYTFVSQDIHGVMTMYQMVRKSYYFPTMLPLINQFVASCYECQSMKEKQPTPKVYYPRIPLDTRLMARVSMDIKEMPKSILGYTCILVCVCEYTNWVKAIPLVNQKAGTIADAIFFRIICEYGTPKAIICDEGPAFTSDLMKMYFHAMNIKPYYNSPMNHGSNRAERYIRTLNNILCRNPHRDWRQLAIICVTLMLGHEHSNFTCDRIFSI